MIIAEWDERLSPEEIVQKYRNFIPTEKSPSPSCRSRFILSDIAAVVAGSKPAALVAEHEVRRNIRMGETLLSMARAAGFSVKRLEWDDFSHYIVGKQENVEAITRLYQDLHGKRTLQIWEYHRQMGEALGYPPEAIESFVSVRVAEDRRRDRAEF